MFFCTIFDDFLKFVNFAFLDFGLKFPAVKNFGSKNKPSPLYLKTFTVGIKNNLSVTLLAEFRFRDISLGSFFALRALLSTKKT